MRPLQSTMVTPFTTRVLSLNCMRSLLWSGLSQPSPEAYPVGTLLARGHLTRDASPGPALEVMLMALLWKRGRWHFSGRDVGGTSKGEAVGSALRASRII